MFNFIATAAPAAAGQAAAQTATASQSAPSGGGFMSLLPIIIIFAVMIFFMSRSQKKQQRKREEMLSRIAKGTKVLLASGIYGVVVEVKDDVFVVEIADNVKIRVARAGIADTVQSETADAKNPDAGSKK